jgi:hypothetical protein
MGARKKPYGKKRLWPAQDTQKNHGRPRCPDFLMVHPYCTNTNNTRLSTALDDDAAPRAATTGARRAHDGRRASSKQHIIVYIYLLRYTLTSSVYISKLMCICI